MSRRVWLLIGLLGAATLVVFFLPPISQSEAYHNFADQRPLLGIPNCLNVISNAPFLIVGLWGVFALASDKARAPRHHTLKHLAAALSAFWILRMLLLRHSFTRTKRTRSASRTQTDVPAKRAMA